MTEHFHVTAGYFVLCLYPVIASNSDQAFFLRDDAFYPFEFRVFRRELFLPPGPRPHVPADDLQFEGCLPFYEQGPVEPGFFPADVIITVTDIDSSCHAQSGIYYYYFMM